MKAMTMSALNSKVLCTVICFVITLVIVAEGYNLNYLFQRVGQGRQRQHQVNRTTLMNAVNFGWQSLKMQQKLEDHLETSRIQVENSSVSAFLLIDGKPNPAQIESDQIAQAIIKSTRYLMDMHCANRGIPDKECITLIQGIRLPEGELLGKCLPIKNDLSLGAFRRLLPPKYRDFVSRVNSHRLPHPRDVAETLYFANQHDLDGIDAPNKTSEGVSDYKRNVFLAAFTQFIEQDVSKTLIRSMKSGHSIECCENYYSKAPPRDTHPSCMPLEIDSADRYYQNKSIGCLNYVRSAWHTSKCVFGLAEQANGATPEINLSQLYGSTVEGLKKLRTYESGLLKITGTEDNSFLSLGSEKYCPKHNNRSSFCYRAGDRRVNANPYMTILYTLFLRSHNRLATKFARQHPTWSDQRLFVKARALNIAIYQKIVYEEWAKEYLGNTNLNQLKPKVARYNDINGVSNEFGQAAIRTYHSMMPGDLNLDGQNLLKLENVFYRPVNLSANNNFQNILQTLLMQRAMAMDSDYVDDLSHNFYESPTSDFGKVGSDAMALDIQRGRDHGISGYVNYLSHCIEQDILDWNDLVGILRPADLNRLQSKYRSVNDIDLLVGLLSEIPHRDAIVGPTSVCIIGEQLLNSQIYDSTFYTKDSTLHGEVRHMSAAKLICQVTNVEQVPRNIFNIPNNENEFIDCDQL